jgi:uncharacterized protein (TIGR00251 family)
MADTLLKLHVIPRSSKSDITGWRDNVLCVKITAPPVEGAANAAVVKFIAESLGIRKSQVELVSGEKSREKTLRIVGLSLDETRSRLDRARTQSNQ